MYCKHCTSPASDVLPFGELGPAQALRRPECSPAIVNKMERRGRWSSVRDTRRKGEGHDGKSLVRETHGEGGATEYSLRASLLPVLVGVVVGIVLLEERLRGDLAEQTDACVVARAARMESD